ncbi:hypothetical protein CF328_g7774, partial [Tilletia controversa]
MSASATSSPAVGTSSSSSAAAAAASAAAQPVVLSRSLQTAISTMHARISKVFAAPSPMASPDLPAARSAVDYVRWIFTGCIIFSFLLLAYEAHK